MNDFRKDMSEIAKDGSWTVFRFLPLFLLIVVVLFVVGFTLNSLDLFGRTVVERKVFENSYQRSEGLRSAIATDEAALAEIERQLSNSNLDTDTRTNLEAQAAAARLRIAANRSKQQ